MVTRTLVNTIGSEKNWSYLDEYAFQSITGKYVWNNAGVSDFDGSPVIGSYSLAEFGASTTTSGTNRFGATRYNQFSSGHGLEVNTTAFDSYTGSITVGCWVYLPTGVLTSSRVIAAKYDEGVSSNRSWAWYFLNTGEMRVFLYYTTVNTLTFTLPSNVVDELFDGWHHLALTIDTSNSTVTVYIDGKIRLHRYNSALTQMVGSTNKLTFGASGNSGLPSGYFNGRLEDFFYTQTVMSFDEIRRLYQAGTKKSGRYDERNRFRIDGEVGPYGWDEYKTSTDLSTRSTTMVDIPDFHVDLPLDGVYDVDMQAMFQPLDDNDSGDHLATVELADSANNSLALRQLGVRYLDTAPAGDGWTLQSVSLALNKKRYDANERIKVRWKIASATDIVYISPVAGNTDTIAWELWDY